MYDSSLPSSCTRNPRRREYRSRVDRASSGRRCGRTIIRGRVLSAEHCPYCGTEHDPDSVCIEQPAWTGRTLPNGIKVLENLGSTRDGPLYRAVEPGGREVALLVPGIGRDFFPASRLPLHHDPRFHQALRIRHVNVAAVHEIGELPNGPGYVVLEYLTGEPLSDILAARGVLPAARRSISSFRRPAGSRPPMMPAWCTRTSRPRTSW